MCLNQEGTPSFPEKSSCIKNTQVELIFIAIEEREKRRKG